VISRIAGKQTMRLLAKNCHFTHLPWPDVIGLCRSELFAQLFANGIIFVGHISTLALLCLWARELDEGKIACRELRALPRTD